MKTSSAKAKGRKACKEVQDLMYLYDTSLELGDIEITSSGATGEDLKLSPAARKIYPWAIECKNQEALNIWAAYEQATEHANGSTLIPIVFYKRNRSELMVTLTAENFMKLVKKYDL